LGRFSEFVHDLLNTLYDDKIWDIWVHKVHDKSFNEFKESIQNESQPVKKMTDDEIKATILDSKSMLESFTPNTEGRG